jgi:TolB-like protein/Flp pilus assembly protein TadD
MTLFRELNRRNVIRVGVSYAVVAWVVAQVADLALESFGTPEWVMKTLLFLMAIGFVVSLFIAWAYELTPEGIKRAEDVDPDQSITHQTGRKLDRLFIVVLLIAILTLMLERHHLGDRETGAVEDTPAVATTVNDTPEVDPSVAVLPFVNMSSDPEQEYFSDGISEEILNVLTRIPKLKVAARTSSFQFKGQNLDVADIGRQLQVNHVLEGSVRKSGNTLRITAQLIEAESGFHLWSETFDRNLEDVFAIQDEIAAAIAVELRALLSGVVGKSSTAVDMQAYEYYLKGRGLVASRKSDDLIEGIANLKRSLEFEPDYASAMATLAKAYVVLPYFSDQMPASEAREQARGWAEKSLDIDSQNVEALAVLGIVFNELDFNPVGALELLKEAVELNPGSLVANNFLGDVYLRIGDLENAMKYESRAAELDPLGPVHLTDLSSIHLIKGEYDRAIGLCNRALALDSEFVHAIQYLGYVYYLLGDVEQLAYTYQRFRVLPNIDADRLNTVGFLLNMARADTRQIEIGFSQRVQLARSGEFAAFNVATEAVQLGDFDTAGEMLLQAYADRDGRWMFPMWIRLPEQAPDSASWQKFWGQPELVRLAQLRKSHGLSPDAPGFAEGATP